jgi:DNA-binding GntR family transcriptional regulator
MARRPSAAPKPRSAPENQERAGQPSKDGVSLAESIYLALRQEIIEGSIAPGDRLRELDIAQRFGISRTPVREALKRLEADGHLEDLPGRGLTVSNPSLSEIMDAYLIREALEGLATRLAAERMLDTDLMHLELIFRQLEVAFATVRQGGAVDEFIDLSYAFDDLIFAAARSPRLLKMIESARASHAQAMRANLRDPKRMDASVEERLEILEAIRRRDGQGAQTAMQGHLQRAREYRIASTLSLAVGARPALRP